jgi:hypothetical protein
LGHAKGQDWWGQKEDAQQNKVMWGQSCLCRCWWGGRGWQQYWEWS